MGSIPTTGYPFEEPKYPNAQTCPECNAKFPDRAALNRHFSYAHPGSETIRATRRTPDNVNPYFK